MFLWRQRALGIIHLISFGSYSVTGFVEITLYTYNLIFNKNSRVALFKFLRHVLRVASSFPVLSHVKTTLASQKSDVYILNLVRLPRTA